MTTTTAEECAREGRLDDALKLLQERVRQEPSQARHRIFLFQLLAVLGRWERALNQLDVLRDLDAGSLAMVHVYGNAVRSEALRAEIFAGKRSPLLFGEPEPWLALLVEALRLTAEAKHEQAGALRARAFEEAPASSGALDGSPFAWIADADARLGPILEVVLQGKYFWVPFARIRQVLFEPPTDLRDLVWSAATFTWTNGGEAAGLVPVRYPGSESRGDPLLALSRKTDWLQPVEGVFEGTGQRMLTTDAGDHALLEVRAIRFDATEPAAPVPAGGSEG
jgi:type VI secretion system protein ImpE